MPARIERPAGARVTALVNSTVSRAGSGRVPRTLVIAGLTIYMGPLRDLFLLAADLAGHEKQHVLHDVTICPRLQLLQLVLSDIWLVRPGFRSR